MYLILVLRVLNTPVNNNQLNNLDSKKWTTHVRTGRSASFEV